MSFADRLRAAKERAQSVVAIAEPEVTEARMDICKACPELAQPVHFCKKCGCLMEAKTKLANQKCPLGKW